MPNPLTEIIPQDKLKLELGSLLWAKYFDVPIQDLTDEETHGDEDDQRTRKELATAWLKAMGFSQVEWAQVSDYCVLLSLAYTEEGGKDTQFILEFNGADMCDISLFNYAGEVSA